MAAANTGEGDCENKVKNRVFFMSHKNTKVINMKALLSALLHLFGWWPIGRGAVGHLWVINVHCVSPDDHYASSENERFNKVQLK
jgi:hypothetical protein